jgi:CheY-like chemotaxis protein
MELQKGPSKVLDRPGGPDPLDDLERRPYQILVVDDDEDIRRLLAHTLARATEFEARVDVAADAAQALQLMGSKEYDVVLSDQIMPEENGISFLMTVKERYPSTIRMLITAHTNLGSVLRAVNLAQVHGYVEKPFDPGEVNAAIYEALLRRQRRERGPLIHVSQVREALKLVRDMEEHLSSRPPGVVRVGITVSFGSAQDFNRFTFEMMQSRYSTIGDVHVFEGRYHVTVNVGGKQVPRPVST